MTLQADGARRIADGSDPRVIEALETISNAGHSALAETRRTVALLRAPEEESDTKPLPHLADVEQLIEAVRATGLPVDLAIEGLIDIEYQAQNLPDLGQRRCTNIASNLFDPIDRHRPDVLALSGGASVETIVLVGCNLDLGAERSYGRCEWYHLNHIGRFIKDLLGSYDHHWSP